MSHWCWYWAGMANGAFIVGQGYHWELLALSLACFMLGIWFDHRDEQKPKRLSDG